MMEIHTHHLAAAIVLARESADAGGGPFGALVVQGNRVVGRGQNRVTLDNDPTAHAEVVALRAACHHLGRFHLADCRIYCSCEPCPMCLGAIYWAHIPTVVYAGTRQDAAAAGFDDDHIYTELALLPAERRVEFIQAQREAASAVFERWRQQADKTPY